MAEFGKHLFKVNRVDKDGKEGFGHAFRVITPGGVVRLTTAAHVVFDHGKQPISFSVRSLVDDSPLDVVSFKRVGDNDIAEAKLEGDQGIELGRDDDIVQDFRLRVIGFDFFHGSTYDRQLIITEIGGIPTERRGRRPLDPQTDTTIEYRGDIEDMIRSRQKRLTQTTWSGLSGAPILNARGEVVGVHCEGRWGMGVNFGIASRYTRESIEDWE